MFDILWDWLQLQTTSKVKGFLNPPSFNKHTLNQKYCFGERELSCPSVWTGPKSRYVYWLFIPLEVKGNTTSILTWTTPKKVLTQIKVWLYRHDDNGLSMIVFISDGHQFFTKSLDGHHIFKSDGMEWWTIKFLLIFPSPSI